MSKPTPEELSLRKASIKAGKTQKQTNEELFLHYHETEALTVAIALLRTAYERVVQLLEGKLLAAGLAPWERRAFFDELSIQRQELEDQIQEPGAYARYEAMARVLGLSPKLPTQAPALAVERGA